MAVMRFDSKLCGILEVLQDVIMCLVLCMFADKRVRSVYLACRI